MELKDNRDGLQKMLRLYERDSRRKSDLGLEGVLKIPAQTKSTDSGIVNRTLDDLLHPDFKEPIKVGIVAAATSTKGSNIDAMVASILRASSSGNYHIVVAPEYSFLPKDGPLSDDAKNKFVETFRRASENGTMIVPGTFIWNQGRTMFNTAYVLYNGKVVFEYHKLKDGGESRIAKKYHLCPEYGSSLGLFNWGNLKVGIEICADGGTLGIKGVKDRDLVFLISAGNRCLKRSMGAVKRKGYGIVADGTYRVYETEQQTEEPVVRFVEPIKHFILQERIKRRTSNFVEPILYLSNKKSWIRKFSTNILEDYGEIDYSLNKTFGDKKQSEFSNQRNSFNRPIMGSHSTILLERAISQRCCKPPSFEAGKIFSSMNNIITDNPSVKKRGS